MSWVILVGAGVMEAVWAISLDKSHGFSNPVPTVVFFAALALSMLGLGIAMKDLPLGTAYAVWVGIGASLTVLYGMMFGDDNASLAKVALLAVLVACVIGLKLVEGSPET